MVRVKRWPAKAIIEAADGAAKAKPPRLKLSGDPLERDILRQLLEFLRFHPKVAWARRMNVGKGLISQRGTRQAPAGSAGSALAAGMDGRRADGPVRGSGPRWIEFGFEGCSDILGQMRDGRILAIEAKSARGVVSAAQQQFIETVLANGGVAGVVRSLDDAADLLRSESNAGWEVARLFP